MKTFVPYALVAEFVEQLGVDVNEVASVGITPTAVTVMTYHLDENGYRHMSAPGANDVVMVETEIRIEREPRE